MKEQNIAKAYARSFLAIGEERNIDVASELTKLTEVINVSNDLENVLFLDVFTIDEKINVLDAIITKLGLNKLIKQMVEFLTTEKRINILPLIYKEVMVYDDHKKGFIRGTIEGVEDSLDQEAKAKIIDYISQKVGKRPELDYVKSDSVTAGYRVTVDDLQLDATVDNQLEQFRTSVLGE